MPRSRISPNEGGCDPAEADYHGEMVNFDKGVVRTRIRRQEPATRRSC